MCDCSRRVLKRMQVWGPRGSSVDGRTGRRPRPWIDRQGQRIGEPVPSTIVDVRRSTRVVDSAADRRLREGIAQVSLSYRDPYLRQAWRQRRRGKVPRWEVERTPRGHLGWLINSSDGSVTIGRTGHDSRVGNLFVPSTRSRRPWRPRQSRRWVPKCSGRFGPVWAVRLAPATDERIASKTVDRHDPSRQPHAIGWWEMGLGMP